MSVKKSHGQFYTRNADYILRGFPMDGITDIVEPFAGDGDLIKWARNKAPDVKISAYDISPPNTCITINNNTVAIEVRDTLLNPPDYTNTWILTNPPYLARNKSQNKEIYDLYDTNDLYKAFILSIKDSLGGIIIIPASFLLSPRDIDVRCRHHLLSRYNITKLRYFEEQVFDDTTTTVIALMFAISETELSEQRIVVEIYRDSTLSEVEFNICAQDRWIIGGDIYAINNDVINTINNTIITNLIVKRFVVGSTLKPGEYQTHMTLNALDSGKQNGRISLTYKRGHIYQAKESSRTFATMIVSRELSEDEQIKVCQMFNDFLEEKRKKYYSLFLPQYRESKEYARKRIPFELAYRIIAHIVVNL
jgi:hypothetical protein